MITHRAHRRRILRRRLTALAGVLAGAIAIALLVIGLRSAGLDDGAAARPATPAAPASGGPVADAPPTPQPHDWGRVPAAGGELALRFRKPPRAGLLVDAGNGRVLWRHEAERRLPIASVTKMMTALIVDERTRPREPVPITPEALAYTGSGVGLLPRGRRVRADTLLYGLLLPSGNDAAIALAQHVSGSVPRFVRLMNERARAMGLTCTRFASPSGIVDRGNWSCAPDLALLGRELMLRPRIARIVRTPLAVMPLPVRGGKVWLANHNPLLRMRYPGADGIKTGYTEAAGRSFVASARRGGRRLIAVLLNSPDPGRQARRLLDAGFARR